MNDYFESVTYCSDDCDKALHLEIARVAGSLWQALPQPSPFTLLALSYFAHGLHMTLPKAFWFPNGELDFRQKIFCLIFITSRLYFSNWLLTSSWHSIFTFHMSSIESDGKKIPYLRECFVYCQSIPGIDLHLHNQTQMLSLSTCVFLIFLLNRHKMTSFSAIPTQFLPQWTGKT